MAQIKNSNTIATLSRRERQVMDIVYARGEATAVDIHAAIADPPSFSATRALIRTLEEKGHIRHAERGLRYVYFPSVPAENVKTSALKHLLTTFFKGSPTELMAAMLDDSDTRISDSELAALESLIRKARGSEK
jgi:BlaI family penicillinase repressor